MKQDTEFVHLLNSIDYSYCNIFFLAVVAVFWAVVAVVCGYCSRWELAYWYSFVSVRGVPVNF